MRFIGHLPARLAVVLVFFCSGVGVCSEQDDLERVTLTPATPNRCQVQYVIEVGGDLVFEEDSQTPRRKLSVVAELSYDELRLAGSEEDEEPLRAVRMYTISKAAIKIDDGGRRLDLRPNRRLIGVELNGSETNLFSPNGSLTRRELDLIETVANSLRIDGLLPTEAVGEGDVWTLSDKFVAGFLDLDAVSKAKVDCKVTEITEEVVRFQCTGEVEGAKHGVVTQLALKGKFRFDRRLGMVDWLGLLVKEERPMGHVTHGLDVVARIQLRILPSEDEETLNEKTLANKTLAPTPELERLLFDPVHADWKLEHDRRWHVNLNQHDLAVFRLIDHGKFIAQCNVSPLEKVEPGKQATLESFQQEIEMILDDEAGGFVDAGQWASDKEYRILRTTVLGKAEESPIQWRYYLVTDQHGRQATFAFTVQMDQVDALGDLDRRFVESLTFTAPEVAMKNGTGTQKEKK